MDEERFDHKGCQVVLALTVCFWIVAGFAGYSVWQAFAQPFPVLP